MLRAFVPRQGLATHAGLARTARRLGATRTPVEPLDFVPCTRWTLRAHGGAQRGRHAPWSSAAGAVAVAGITGLVCSLFGLEPTEVRAAAVPIIGGDGSSGVIRGGGGGAGDRGVADDGLCSVVMTGRVDALAEALKNPAQSSLVNAVGASGLTPLMVAAFHGHVDAIRLLLDNGADTEIESKLTRSMPHWRVYVPQYSPVGKGFKAFDFAMLGGHPDAVALLIERGRMDPTIPRQLSKRGSEKARGGLPPGAGQEAGGAPEDTVSPEVLVDRCHRVVNAPNFDAKESERALLLAAVKRGRELRDERLRRHRAQFPLETRLEEQLVGQQVAIQAVSSAVRRKENGWFDEDSPLVMLFMGSSGIGKTRTAKLIGEYIHGADGDKEKLSKCFVRIDMSEFQHKHEVSKFIGAPPGYVGYESGGQLVSKLEKCPNAVVLLDEVEKAHPDVLTVMLQAFDEGRITDGQGKTVNCADAIFVLTSNLAQREIADEAVRLRNYAASKAQREDETDRSIKASLDTAVDPLTRRFKRDVVQPILRKHFGRDEFLGRINEILFFLPFTQDEQCLLARKELEAWKKRAEKKLNIELTWTPDVEAIAAEEYDLRYGARSIKYEIDRMCIAPIARAQEQGVVTPGCKVHVDIDWEMMKQIREAAATTDDSRLEQEADRLKAQLAASAGSGPRLPSSLGGSGLDDAREEARRQLEAAIDEKKAELKKKIASEKAANGSKKQKKGNNGNGSKAGDDDADAPADPPKPLPGAKLYRGGKVALHVMPRDGSSGGGLGRFFGFGGKKESH